MQELTVKKCAEVAAFVRLSGDIVARSGIPFAAHAPECQQSLTSIAKISFGVEIPSVHTELFTTKTDKTYKKLTAMMEMYIGDEWDNPIEVLEWCSFYAGAGEAHCAISGRLLAGEDGGKRLIVTIKDLQDRFAEALRLVIGRLSK